MRGRRAAASPPERRDSGPGPGPGPGSGPGSGSGLGLVVWLVVGIFAITAFWASVATLVAFYDVWLPAAFLIATVQCGSVPLAVIRSRLATILQLAAVLAQAVAGAQAIEHPWPLPVVGLIVLCAFLVVVGVRQGWIQSLVTWWVAFGTLVLAIVLDPAVLGHAGIWGYSLLIDVTATLLVLGGAVAVGQRRAVRRQLADARRDTELEHARRRVGEERARIARELHDVVAHSMSIVHIQATSAKYRLVDLDPRAAAEFDEIAASARDALGEMRQLLGALRPDDAADADADERRPLAPQPQLSDLPQLTDGAERVGTTTHVVVDAAAHDLSPILQLTAYRIVQEALSNAVRHAPGASTRVTVALDPTTLVVEVVNEAPGDGHRRSADAGGMGLRGMAERVALVDGALEHGETAEGGFRVAARLPAEAVTESPRAAVAT